MPADSVIDASRFAVDVLEEQPARAFVEQHHYSGTFPAKRLAVGLWRGRELAGAAVFSVPNGPVLSADATFSSGVRTRHGPNRTSRFPSVSTTPQLAGRIPKGRPAIR